MTTSPVNLSRPSWKSNLLAVWAIARMDWKQYWRYPLNAISSVFEPVVWLTPIYFMGLAFSVNGQARGFAGYAGTSDYISFVIIGNALSNFIGSVFWGMGYALKNDMDAGVLESNWLSPLSRPLILVGKTINNLLITTLTSLGIFLCAGIVFGVNITGNALAAVMSALPMLIGLYGFGFAFAALVLLVRDANTLVDTGNYLVMTFSGSNFPVNALPRWLLPISLALPTTYGFDAVRSWLLGTQTILPISTEIGILIVSMVLLIAIGLRAFHALERHVRVKGTLGQY